MNIEKLKTFLFLLQYFVLEVKCSILVEDRVCGTLFSGRNFDGESFILKDFDQSVNLRKDYRNSISGWWNTRSIRIEDGCSLTISDESYFQGVCLQRIESGNHSMVLESVPRSVSCTCSRKCNCDDIHLPISDGVCGRAYVSHDGCNKCDAPYVHLEERGWWSIDYQNSVKSIVLRSGCNLTIYQRGWYRGKETLITETITDHSGKISSYRCKCDDKAYKPEDLSTVNPPIVKLPGTKEKLLALIGENDTITEHLGVRAARMSSENMRSSKNAYILLIGTHRFPWWDLNTMINGRKFGETQVPVNLEKRGLYGSKLRIIYADFDPESGSQGESEDAKWAASIDEYLSNHAELKDAIPNAVIIFHSPFDDNLIHIADSRFQRKLKLVNSLSPLILDKRYSNLIFLLHEPQDIKHPRYAEIRLAAVEMIIERQFNFPLPIIVLPSSELSPPYPKVNGYRKLGNEEYWPRNLQESLKLISEKGGDPLGYAIFSAAFPDINLPELKHVKAKEKDFVLANHTKVEYYRQLLVNPISIINNLSETCLQRQAEKQLFEAGGTHTTSAQTTTTAPVVSHCEPELSSEKDSSAEFVLTASIKEIIKPLVDGLQRMEKRINDSIDQFNQAKLAFEEKLLEAKNTKNEAKTNFAELSGIVSGVKRRLQILNEAENFEEFEDNVERDTRDSA